MSQGCWTCRDRKVRCDLRVPTCASCFHAKRVCLGYGFRLAWPRGDDKRRMLVHTPLHASDNTDGYCSSKSLLLVNISLDDIRLHYNLSERDRKNAQSLASTCDSGLDIYTVRRCEVQPLPLSKMISWELCDERGRSFLDFYMTLGADMFACHQGQVLAPLMLKIAFSDTSKPSKAVLHAILALSSSYLHRDEDAMAYRATAVSLLSASLTAGPGQKIAFQNIASSMLLCLFEICHVSETSVNWAMYLCGIKNIILDGLTHIEVQDQECIIVKDWIYFYEVFARFSLVHWIDHPKRDPICYTEPLSNLIQVVPDQSHLNDICTIGYSRNILDAISGLTRLVFFSTTGCYIALDRQQLARSIEIQLRSIIHTVDDHHTQPNNDPCKAAKIKHFYALGALIYLNKIALGYSGEDIHHQKLVDKAFVHLIDIQIGDAPWPFFVVGCEATSDAQRKTVLQAALNAESDRQYGNATRLMQLIQAFWNQDDLGTGQTLGYVKRMSAVISNSPFLPVFA